MHHHSSSDGVEWVRGNTGQSSDGLGDEVLNNEMLVLQSEDTVGRIVHSEVDSSVEDDSPDGDDESLVKSLDSISGGDLSQTIESSVELSLSSRSDISGKSGSDEVQWVDEHQRSSSGSSSRDHRSEEVLDWLSLWVEWAEPISVGILEGEVQGLGWEVSHDVSHVSSPEGTNSFLLRDSAETINDTGVSLDFSGLDLLVGILGLEQELDSLNWGDSSLGDGSGNTSDQEILNEISLFLSSSTTFRHL